ncbi:hypothetical protein C8R46DRAFT_1139627 [Mycena filopes]|nr:hypothetical protein C8R46DRAFT_1139627 [Mycena filopes]
MDWQQTWRRRYLHSEITTRRAFKQHQDPYIPYHRRQKEPFVLELSPLVRAAERCRARRVLRTQRRSPLGTSGGPGYPAAPCDACAVRRSDGPRAPQSRRPIGDAASAGIYPEAESPSPRRWGAGVADSCALISRRCVHLPAQTHCNSRWRSAQRAPLLLASIAIYLTQTSTALLLVPPRAQHGARGIHCNAALPDRLFLSMPRRTSLCHRSATSWDARSTPHGTALPVPHP